MKQNFYVARQQAFQNNQFVKNRKQIPIKSNEMTNAIISFANGTMNEVDKNNTINSA